MFKSQLIGKTANIVVHTLGAKGLDHRCYNDAKILDIDTNYILLLNSKDNLTYFHSGNISIDVSLRD